MNRYRIVTTQDGKEHISSVVLSLDEANDQIEVQRMILKETGWQVVGSTRLICQKLIGGKRVKRTIFVREFTPLEDHVSQT